MVSTLLEVSASAAQPFGKKVFELLAEKPEQDETFHRSMINFPAVITKAILSAYDFSVIRRIADVGGGRGSLLASILKRYQDMRGVVYDLPEVVADALSEPHWAGCRDRIQVEGGNFFQRAPEHCDAYMMKFILRDWSDDFCRRILHCIREQLPPDGRVLVMERLATSISMLSPAVGGKERTISQFSKLFTSAGLRLTQVIHTGSPVCILEARLR